jgi:hypothetical protein
MEETFCKRLFEELGLKLKQKEVRWTMGLVGRPGQEGIEFFSIDREKGVSNFFDFFAFGSGMEMPRETRAELKRLFGIMGKMTLEEKRAFVGTSWTDWLERNCKDALVSTILSVHCQLSGFSSEDTAAGGVIGSYAPFHEAGAVPFWYPAEGTLEDEIIQPLKTYIREAGGQISTSTKVLRIDIDRQKVNGVWSRNTVSDTIEKIKAPIVVSAIPIHQAAGHHGILAMDVFPEDWQTTIRTYRERADEDLTGFYLLREKVIPDQTYGWVHLFDAGEGMPNYVGDWLKGEFTNARVPPGKQLVYTFITANNSLSPFGRESDLNKVEKALGCWEGAMEKAFPGFQETIDYKTYTLQLNWGRFSLGSVPAEIEVRSPTTEGLYFAGDSPHTVASLASDKVFEVAKYCEQAILRDRA